MKKQLMTTLAVAALGVILALPQAANAVAISECDGRNVSGPPQGVEMAFIPTAVETVQAVVTLIDEDLLNLVVDALDGSD
ncbi:hypothetical protein [Candidatus Thiodictyon syntrophicum]|jgi:hypothetical protein|uniref:ABC transporter substrate-binding protein n=1 Tax=Candidatus Thiodictyon syntrophicum TaxID=1166950 RepID=A0A2K8U818_9GAMM|nr:hypothetical protein [Candidatus Thiodictyon syntrophicum]AUB81726.1 hypothetical protein THSYN_12650 [Candidatus Thiodictyon syntrophicum]